MNKLAIKEDKWLRFWSSSEVRYALSWTKYFDDCYQTNDDGKTNSNWVRAVRRMKK